jgi:hypothetical protein
VCGSWFAVGRSCPTRRLAVGQSRALDRLNVAPVRAEPVEHCELLGIGWRLRRAVRDVVRLVSERSGERNGLAAIRSPVRLGVVVNEDCPAICPSSCGLRVSHQRPRVHDDDGRRWGGGGEQRERPRDGRIRGMGSAVFVASSLQARGGKWCARAELNCRPPA